MPAAPSAPPLPGIGCKFEYLIHIGIQSIREIFVFVVTRPIKRKIDTKYKLPLLNWVAIPPTKIGETVFNEIDDENIYKSVDFTEFEESFKLRSQADSLVKGNKVKGNVHMYVFLDSIWRVSAGT